ncbi:MAG TPA: heavy metal translocating P-type ATPase, partial [Tissierellaceae bacterium]|nr:heavy metal translocating P-type ATPase [Tissierellaceae bacterium]
LEGTQRFIVYLAAYLAVGHQVIFRAIKNVMAGMAFDENFLMTIATIAAFAIGEYPEGVAVMLFYQVGEMFQGMAVNRSRKSISALLDIRPDYANLVTEDEIIIVDPEDVKIGDYIIIKAGEKVPLDGEVVEGESFLDTSNITGESVPRSVKVGDQVFSGVVNTQGLLKIKVSKEFGESTVTKILDLVENASSKKAPTENFITKFAKYYTPVVVIIALAIAIFPPILFQGEWQEWIYRAAVFLVISCPCALVISIPLGFFGGIGGASRAGILIKGGNFLEALNNIDTLVFDKTGTITKGVFKVTEIISYEDYSKEEILELAAYGESFSNHPIGNSIVDAYEKEINRKYIKDYREISGKGIQVSIDDKDILLGNKALLDLNNIPVEEATSIGTVVYVAKEGRHIGTIIVSDELKEGVIEDIKKLRSLGIKETIMLSGDNEETTKRVGKLVGLDKVYGNLLPGEKVDMFEKIIAGKRSHVAFVGDGVNDAPVLARADIGIAMGGLGSDAAIEASDIVIMTDEIGKIGTGFKIAKNTKKIVTQNIVFALGVKLIVLSLGAMGIATMWEAVFADVGVSVIAILNSIRALKVEE